MTTRPKILALLTVLTIGLFQSLGQAATGTLMPTPFQVFLDNNGNPISGGKVCTYAAGTTTPAATYTDSALTVPNGNPIVTDIAGRFTAWLPPGAAFKFIYQNNDGTANTCNGTVIKTVDNISAVPGSSSSLDITGTAGETLTAGQAVYLSDGSGSKTAGQWFKADSANPYSSTLAEVGIVPAAITSGSQGTVRLSGQMTGLAGLSIGSLYFVGSAGALTSTPPANRRYLGMADTTSTLDMGRPSLTQNVGVMTHGQLIIGSTGAAPAVGTLAAGTGLTSTTGAGTLALAANSYTLDKSLTEQIVTNTSAETSIYTPTIAANTLIAGRALRLSLSGSLINTSGGSVNLTLKVKLGGVTVFSAVFAAANGYSIAPNAVTGLINANNAANSQRAWVQWQQPGANITDGSSTAAPVYAVGGHSALAVDMTSSQTVDVTVTWASAASTITFKRWAATLELLQ